MMSIQEQAVQMINHLSDDNVKYLIDFMKRFMMPKDDEKSSVSAVQTVGSKNLMQEMESMRMRAKSYFPSDFAPDTIWDEAMEEKYGSAN